jgi:hypothetical protein
MTALSRIKKTPCAPGTPHSGVGMRFGIHNYGIGLGDLLVYSLFLVAS